MPERNRFKEAQSVSETEVKQAEEALREVGGAAGEMFRIMQVHFLRAQSEILQGLLKVTDRQIERLSERERQREAAEQQREAAEHQVKLPIGGATPKPPTAEHPSAGGNADQTAAQKGPTTTSINTTTAGPTIHEVQEPQRAEHAEHAEHAEQGGQGRDERRANGAARRTSENENSRREVEKL